MATAANGRGGHSPTGEGRLRPLAGVAHGDPWWWADGSRSGVFEGPEQDMTPEMPAYAALYRCAVSDDARMQALGKPFEIDWFDAGHGGLEVEQLIAFQERMLIFAHRIVRELQG